VLGEAGVVVISGLARGIDQAHAGALRPGGRTAAVLGRGVEVVYSREHRPLMEATRARGAGVLQGPDDLLERLGFPAPVRSGDGPTVVLERDGMRMLGSRGEGPRHVDDIGERVGAGARRALAALVTCEVRGLVRRQTGQRCARRPAFHRLGSGGDAWPNHSLS
jgi:predicted Rossmann fold nucleotide-binding protein DprA/Smf involved in DNA uptake